MKMGVPFKKMFARALEIRALFEGYEKEKYGTTWKEKDIMIGLVGDIGDLSKIVLAHEGIRDIPDKREKLKHELSDCLWSLMILAHNYNIDLESEFFATMNSIEKKLTA